MIEDNDFPDDADGQTIKSVVQSGSDLSRPMDVDIQIYVEKKPEVKKVKRKLKKAGYSVRTEYHEEDNDWDVIATSSMILSYKSIVALQAEVSELLAALDCQVDGWGTLGNLVKS